MSQSGYNRIGREFSPRTREEIFRRDNNQCQICGRRQDLHPHHILPIGVAIRCFSYLPDEIIANAVNGMIVCDDCHPDLHPQVSELLDDPDFNYDEIYEEYQFFAVALLNYWAEYNQQPIHETRGQDTIPPAKSFDKRERSFVVYAYD